MKLDPVTLEILGHKVTALTEEMCLTLQRTGRTLYVKETADFCCAMAGLDGKFFAYPRNMGVSGFVGLDCLATIQAVGPLEPGDVIITNDPYLSKGLATHLTDIQTIAPYFHEGRVVAYGWAFLHASDVGGRVPSSISPTNTEIFQEGLQIPPLKLVRKGVLNEDVVAFLNANSRTPDANLGDIKAMLAALATGSKRIAQIIARHGGPVLLQAQEDLQEYSALRASTVLRRIPEGSHRFVDYLDDEAGSGLPVRIALSIERNEDTLHLDFTGTDPQVAAAINIPSHGQPHAWLTLRLLALVCTLDKIVPVNAGILRPLRITAPAGSVVNPTRPAAVGVRHAAAVRVNDTLNGVLGQALPDLMPAASGGTIIPIVVAEPAASGSGRNVQVIEPLVGGTGGRHGSDGADGRDSSISNLANNPVETVEAEVGVQILRYGLRPDSGGPGQWRGGCGQEIVFRILQDESTLLARGMERLRFQPWGAQGGEAGASTRLLLNAGTPRERTLGKIDTLAVQAGDEITLQGPGGGGWGDPMQRPPEAVMNDVRNGLVSVESARARYGVAVEAGGRLDQQETARLRQQPRHDGDVSARLGLAREHWDAAFECPLLDRLNRALFALPVERRARQRKLALDAAMANLPPGFPAEAASPHAIEAARSALLAHIEALEIPHAP
ncbi:N-methylhydantoinase B OS=Castellaniella defragrans OX=75697 GN=HNR28_001150 PE=4 SV=1 [Castellaniella defragrans]